MVLGAVTLGPEGGGIAAASRLMWLAVQERWNGDARLITLRRSSETPEAGRSGLASRLLFGASVARSGFRPVGRSLLFAHLSLARVQRVLPQPFRRPYVVFLHGIEAWRTLSREDSFALRNAKLLMANSRYTAHRVAREHALEKPIEVCPLALEPDIPAADVRLTARWRERIGPKAVITVGRMASGERYKGHDQLLESWDAVRARVPGARLVFAGNGDDLPRLQSKAASLGLGDDVVFAGFLARPELDALYAAAAVFAMPSREEGFGLAYLEAMSHGLPCIGSIHDAAGEVIADGASGCLVDQSDLESLSGRLTQLLNDEERRRAMGLEGFRRARLQFSYGQFRHRLLELLARVEMS
jgi:phosphatidylinositol alpha-1,6-mannosyltransferase